MKWIWIDFLIIAMQNRENTETTFLLCFSRDNWQRLRLNDAENLRYWLKYEISLKDLFAL